MATSSVTGDVFVPYDVYNNQHEALQKEYQNTQAAIIPKRRGCYSKKALENVQLIQKLYDAAFVQYCDGKKQLNIWLNEKGIVSAAESKMRFVYPSKDGKEFVRKGSNTEKLRTEFDTRLRERVRSGASLERPDIAIAIDSIGIDIKYSASRNINKSTLRALTTSLLPYAISHAHLHNENFFDTPCSVPKDK